MKLKIMALALSLCIVTPNVSCCSDNTSMWSKLCKFVPTRESFAFWTSVGVVGYAGLKTAHKGLKRYNETYRNRFGSSSDFASLDNQQKTAMAKLVAEQMNYSYVSEKQLEATVEKFNENIEARNSEVKLLTSRVGDLEKALPKYSELAKQVGNLQKFVDSKFTVQDGKLNRMDGALQELLKNSRRSNSKKPSFNSSSSSSSSQQMPSPDRHNRALSPDLRNQKDGGKTNE